MRPTLIAAVLLAGCGRDQPAAAPRAEADLTIPSRSGWDLQSTGEGTALVAAAGNGSVALRLFCPAGERRLVVNVPAFRPIGSEERLSFGQGGEAVALVADASGDEQRGGVTGEGPVPANLVALLSGEVAASYGAQVSGPHPAPPAAEVQAFEAECAGSKPGGPTQPAAPSASNSPCLAQDGQPVPVNAIRALGTEPFWAARVEGRCVTYSQPDDQKGTRVWTKFSGTATAGTWTGSLNGRPFVMTTRPQAGCSDGMSDKRYPIAVSLSVGGEQRSGCAEPS
ncbi:MAG: hypothetical protein M3428_06080 [Pseudomonadota bacterium]|nr:hypothetical protein [Pseudomonadota bacterium]